MKVEEFVKDKETVKKIELVTDYIPYIEKISHCKSIAKTTSHKVVNKKEIFMVDSPTRHLFYLMKLVQLYTNIEFEDTAIAQAYDILNQNGVLDILFGDPEQLIPEKELIEWKSLMEMVMDDMFENERSMTSVLDNLKDSVDMILLNMFKQIEDVVDENNGQVQIELKDE